MVATAKTLRVCCAPDVFDLTSAGEPFLRILALMDVLVEAHHMVG